MTGKPGERIEVEAEAQVFKEPHLEAGDVIALSGPLGAGWQAMIVRKDLYDRGELTRLEVLRDLDQRRLTTEAAARLLRLERRQVFRLLKAYRTAGPAGLISKRRGRRGNRRKPEALRKAALAIIREWYWDFGPTLAAEKLREVHGITLGRETLRLWMIEAGLWLDRKQRRKRVHQPRYRRDCVGESLTRLISLAQSMVCRAG